jgi:hypothetical protein
MEFVWCGFPVMQKKQKYGDNHMQSIIKRENGKKRDEKSEKKSMAQVEDMRPKRGGEN